MARNEKIMFIGAGRMATAIAIGMVKNGFSRTRLTAFDCAAAAAAQFTRSTGVECPSDSAKAGLEGADAVLLAVKPQYLGAALKGKKALLQDKLIISIVAGAQIKKLSELTGASRIVRVMPNTPALLGAGCGAYAVQGAVTAADRELTTAILGAIGEFTELNESLLDAVTALSGCGPAYVFEMIQAMADGGVTAGLPRELAQRLAALTVKGAAEMVLAGGVHPIALRDQVCSPGGATIVAVNELANRGFSGAVVAAELAALAKSVELGR